MSDERNQYQIIRKDAKNCFVESLNDAFPIEKVHFVFATYDVSKPAGQRQTNNIHIYVAVDEFLELCRKLNCGELRYIMQNKKTQKDSTPIFQSLGGTSSQKLAEQGRARADGKCLSRTIKLVCGEKTDFLLIADSGPGDATDKGLIVPKFGNKPENHVAVSMTFETLSGLLLTTKIHYEAFLAAYYMGRNSAERQKYSHQTVKVETEQKKQSTNTTQAKPKFVPGEMF